MPAELRQVLCKGCSHKYQNPKQRWIQRTFRR